MCLNDFSNEMPNRRYINLKFEYKFRRDRDAARSPLIRFDSRPVRYLPRTLIRAHT